MPRTRRPENADRRRTKRSSDVQQPGIVRDRHGSRRQRHNGVAQIAPRKIARLRTGRNFRRKRLLVGAAENPDIKPLRAEAAREIRVGGTWPPL